MSQNDKNLSNDLKAMRDSIMTALESHVYIRCFDESYRELDNVCTYLQWTIDYSRFEEDTRKHLAMV